MVDSNINSTNAQSYLTKCINPPISSDLIDSIVGFFNGNADLFKVNSTLILTVIEKLILLNKLDEACKFVNQVVLEHFDVGVNIEALTCMFIRVCPLVHVDHRNQLCKELISPITFKLSLVTRNKKLAPLLFDFVLCILDLCVRAAPQCAENLLGISEFYPWKELAPRFTDLVRLCIAYEKFDEKSYWNELNSLGRILNIAGERAAQNKVIFRATHDQALQALLRWSGSSDSDNTTIWSTHVYNMAEAMMNLIDQQKITVDICTQLIQALYKGFFASEVDENQEDVNSWRRYFFMNLGVQLAKYIEYLKMLPHEAHRQLALFILASLECQIQDEMGVPTREHTAATQLWYKIGPCLTNEVDARLYDSCIKKIYSLVCDDGEETFYTWWCTFWSIVAMKLQDVAADYVEDFLSDTIDRKKIGVASLLPMLYNKRPEPYHVRLNDLVNVICNSDMLNIVLLGQIFTVIVKEHSELITADQLDRLFASIKNRTSGAGYELDSIFQGLGFVANTKPNLFRNYQAVLLRFVVEQHNLSAFNCLEQYFVSSTIINGQQTANECLTVLIDLLKRGTEITNDILTQIFHACQSIGIVNKQALETKRTDLTQFNSYTECRRLIDFIDGTKLSEENQTSINRTREEIVQMEKRVVKTENDVNIVKETVKQQELKVTDLGARVDVVDTRLDKVTEQVQVHTREIEQIDAKTLSYVPSEWGREVSKLLNVKTDNDWRLLGKRFGYSASELRHWALQVDPCMALLNEWFMAHKADEATYGLIKMLEEIGRQDVAKIIRDAVATAGELIPDDMPFEIKRLPPVFLSYQWGAQKAVTILKSHLEQAGYSCWMDTGQMGGGDKLFSKIDAGIRGTKVVICCMNAAYAQSDNCSREVHLCVSTGKPLIPLQMEKQTWPPEGALGPIMSEYLYIRFYDRKSNTQDYWPADRFTELLGQIRYHVAPDPDMISQQYYNWFVPRVDNLIFLKPATANDNKVKQPTLEDDTPLVVTHAQVMISYQWDRQQDIVELYKRLTQLGYKCWLDIFQMGGGDSLFEKIDDGIRNAKCILACVTPKYTQSINCRREMSLADALKKPIVPLLFEETSTWPPPGPMALVFTNKPYIDFRRSNEKKQDTDIWTSKKFQTVLARLRETVPEVQADKARRHLLDMKRPTTAEAGINGDPREARVKSAPVVPQSRACSLM